MIRAFTICMAVVALLVVAACAREPGSPDGSSAEDPALAPPDSLAQNRYERHLTFFALEEESPLVVAWSFSALTRPAAVDREARIWLARGGQWDAFFRAAWETPATRAPWRIVPHEGIRIIVGARDALTALLYQSGSRSLEVLPGEALAGWSSRPGERVQVREASAMLRESATNGKLVDVSFAQRASGAMPGSWAFLTSGDTQVFLRGSFDAESDSTFQAWGTLGAGNFDWPGVIVTTTRATSFEPARRDVPVAWQFQSPDGTLTGRMESRSSHMEAGDGPGPQLPTIAISEVEGSVEIEGTPYRVHGVFHYRVP